MKSKLETLHKRVAGIDVHRMKHVVTVLIEDAAGNITRHTREFGGFKRDLKALAAWLREMGVELVILESTGIYWKSVYARLEEAGLVTWVVNAHHVKNVPGPQDRRRRFRMAGATGSLRPGPAELHSTQRPARTAPGQPLPAQGGSQSGGRDQPAAQDA